jgi:hypothetical protein
VAVHGAGGEPATAATNAEYPSAPPVTHRRGITHESTPRIPGSAVEARLATHDRLDAGIDVATGQMPPPGAPRAAPLSAAAPVASAAGTSTPFTSAAASTPGYGGPGPSRLPLHAMGGPTESVDAQFVHSPYQGDDPSAVQDNTSVAINNTAHNSNHYGTSGALKANTQLGSFRYAYNKASGSALVSPNVVAAPPVVPPLAMSLPLASSTAPGPTPSPALDCARRSSAVLPAISVAVGLPGRWLDSTAEVAPLPARTTGVATGATAASVVPESSRKASVGKPDRPSTQEGTESGVMASVVNAHAKVSRLYKCGIDMDRIVPPMQPPPPPTPSSPTVANIINEHASGRHFTNDVVASLNTIKKRPFAEMFHSNGAAAWQSSRDQRAPMKQVPPGVVRMGIDTPPNAPDRSTPDRDAASERKPAITSPQFRPPPGKKLRLMPQSGAVVSDGVAALAAGSGRPAALGPFSGVLAGAVGGPPVATAAAEDLLPDLHPGGPARLPNRSHRLSAPPYHHPRLQSELPPPAKASSAPVTVAPLPSTVVPHIPVPTMYPLPSIAPDGNKREATTPLVRPKARRPPSGFVTPQDIIRTLQNKTARRYPRASLSASDGKLHMSSPAVNEVQPLVGSAFGPAPSRNVDEYGFLGSKIVDRRTMSTPKRPIGGAGFAGAPPMSAFGTLQQRHGPSASGGLVTDLRPAFPKIYSIARGFPAGRSGAIAFPSPGSRPAGLGFVSGASDGILQARGCERSVAVSSSAKRILESLDKVSSENRAITTKRARSPLGLPAGAKRQRRSDSVARDESANNVIGGAEWFMTTIQAHAAAAAAAISQSDTTVVAPSGARRKRLVVGEGRSADAPNTFSRPPVYGAVVRPTSTDAQEQAVPAERQSSAFKPYGRVAKVEGSIGKKNRRAVNSFGSLEGKKKPYAAALLMEPVLKKSETVPVEQPNLPPTRFLIDSSGSGRKTGYEPDATAARPAEGQGTARYVNNNDAGDTDVDEGDDRRVGDNDAIRGDHQQCDHRADIGSSDGRAGSDDCVDARAGDGPGGRSEVGRCFSFASSVKSRTPISATVEELSSGPAPQRETKDATPQHKAKNDESGAETSITPNPTLPLSKSAFTTPSIPTTPFTFATNPVPSKVDVGSHAKDSGSHAKDSLTAATFSFGDATKKEQYRADTADVNPSASALPSRSAATSFPSSEGGGLGNHLKEVDNVEDEDHVGGMKPRMTSISEGNVAGVETTPPVPSGSSLFKFNVPNSGSTVGGTGLPFGTSHTASLCTLPTNKSEPAQGEKDSAGYGRPPSKKSKEARSLIGADASAVAQLLSFAAPGKPSAHLSSALFSCEPALPEGLGSSVPVSAVGTGSTASANPVTAPSGSVVEPSLSSGLEPASQEPVVSRVDDRSALTSDAGEAAAGDAPAPDVNSVANPAFSLAATCHSGYPIPSTGVEPDPHKNATAAPFCADPVNPVPFSFGASVPAAPEASFGGESSSAFGASQPSNMFASGTGGVFGSTPVPVSAGSTPAIAFSQGNVSAVAKPMFGFTAAAPASASGPIFGGLGASASTSGNPFANGGTPFPTSLPPPTAPGASPSAGLFTFGAPAPAPNVHAAAAAVPGSAFSFAATPSLPAATATFPTTFGASAPGPFGALAGPGAVAPVGAAFGSQAQVAFGSQAQVAFGSSVPGSFGAPSATPAPAPLFASGPVSFGVNAPGAAPPLAAPPTAFGLSSGAGSGALPDATGAGGFNIGASSNPAPPGAAGRRRLRGRRFNK